MISQNQTEKDAKALTIPGRDSIAKPGEPQVVARELTDEEIAAVAGGGKMTPIKQ